MSGELRDFDPELVTATWVLPTGPISLHIGLIGGPSSIRVVKATKRATRKTDRNGNQVRNRTANKSGSLFFTYQAEAQIQASLSAVIAAEDLGVPQVGPIVIRNLNSGVELFSYLGCAIDDEPNEAFGESAEDRVYEFGFAKREAVAAGTPAVGA